MTDLNTIKIYHNPRCSKSCQTLKLLEQKGVMPEVVEYLDAPPTKAELESILDMLSIEPRDLMRKHEAEYQQAGMDNESLSRDELIQLMVDNPKVIERPIVVANGKAIIGRPPELVLDIV